MPFAQRKNILVAVTLCLLGAQPTLTVADRSESPWHTDPSVAIREARSRDLDILVCFTGTSWCGPCQRLEHDVFGRPGFREAERSFILLKLDYPQRDEDLAPALRATYLDWRDRYVVEASPTVFLLDRNALPYAVVVDLITRPDQAVSDLIALQQIRVRRDERLARAAAQDAVVVTLIDEALDELLASLDPDHKNLGRSRVARFYAPEVDRLLAKTNDPALATKYRTLLGETPDADPVRAISARIRTTQTVEGNPAALKLVAANLATPQSIPMKKALMWWKHSILDRSLEHQAAYDWAQEMVRSAEFTAEENRQVRRSMLRSLVYLGRIDESLVVLRSILAELPADPAAAYSAVKDEAQLLTGTQRDVDVLRLWEEADRLVRPGSIDWVDVQIFRARTHSRLNQFPQATTILRDARRPPELDPLDLAHLFAEEALIHKKSGDLKTARQVAAEGETLFRRLASTQSADSLAYLRQKLDVAQKP